MLPLVVRQKNYVKHLKKQLNKGEVMNIGNPFSRKKRNAAKKPTNPADVEGTPEYHVRIISNSKVFPEELIKAIEEELLGKSVTREPTENKPEEKKVKKEKIKFNFDMVSTSTDLKMLTEKVIPSLSL